MTETDLKKTKSDEARIDVSQPQDVKLWSQRLGVSPTKLRDAVALAGPTVTKVKSYLGLR
jgi:Protein of unknown function (DUF3606)